MIVKHCALDLFDQRGGPSPSLVTAYDKSRYRHDLSMHNVTWVQGATGMWLAVYNGTNAYMHRAHATTEALGITGGLNDGYTIMGWINWTDTGQSLIIAGRYEVSVGGWELYLTENAGVYYLTQRHHHAGTLVDGEFRSASNSVGWTPGTPYFFTVVFQGNGTDCIHYRNAVPLAILSSTGGIRDFEATIQQLVIGIRYDLAANWYEGTMGGFRFYPYIWTPAQIRARYHAEKYHVGVPV
ncbi:hypothetical protein LCGC14_0852910 [marine sediment metagenome]|uniref:Uncharacterized protein n=1 Tax=marine sediment metagenome TaxID=412755 RepID=A0A0F9RU80_9ZZZZ